MSWFKQEAEFLEGSTICLRKEPPKLLRPFLKRLLGQWLTLLLIRNYPAF